MRSVSVFRFFCVYGAASWFSVSGAGAQVAAPVLVPLNADGATPFEVTVTSTTPGAEIRYTLNGSDPTVTDLQVASGGTIPVNRAVTIKAKAWLGGDSSPVTTSTYSVTGNLSAGEIHSLLLSSEKALRGSGTQGAGRLGNGVTSGNALSPVASQYPAPISIIDAVSLAGGMDHSLFVKLNTADGTLSAWSFGDNAAGELGNNSAAGSHSRAVQVIKSTTATDYLTGIHEVAAGTNFSLAVHADGSVFSWGTKTNGRLGDGAGTGSRKYAGKVKRGDIGTYPDLSGILSVRAGNGSAFGREACDFEVSGGLGRVWVWGLNTSGQLGCGNTTNQTRAVLMKDNAGATLTDVWDVSVGELHTAVVRRRGGTQPINGRVWCFGQQSNGRLGNGSTASGVVSLPPENPVNKDADGLPLEQITAVAAGAAHVLALDELGNVWSWGYNATGALGDASTTNRSRAVRVKATAPTGNPATDLLQNIVAISAGGTGTTGYSLALASDGTVYAWGRNANGQHGNGTSTTAAVTRPVAIPNFKLLPGYPEVGLSSVVAPAGASGTVALTATPTDPDGAGTIASVKFYVDGVEVGERTSAPWSYAYVPSEAGSYHAFALVTDATGIQGQSPPANFSVHAPAVTLGAQVAPPSAPGTVLLTASPSDADGTGNLASVKFYVGGAFVGQRTSAPWTCSHVPSSPGSYQATAVVTDAFGLETTSAPAPFSVSSPQVTVAITPLLREAPGFASVVASPTDADGALNLSHVDFYLAGNHVASATAPLWSADLSGVPAGSQSVVAVAVDQFGFTGNSPSSTLVIYPAEGAADADSDGMPDWWESLYGLNPNNASDAAGDLLGDGVTNLAKYQTGRNPLVAVLTDSTGATGLQVHTPLD